MAPLCALLVLLGCLASANGNPGIIVRMNQSFFDFMLKEKLEPLLKKDILSYKIPAVKYHISGINIDMDLSSLVISNIAFSPAILTPSSATSSLEATMGVHMGGDGVWETRTGWWPHIKEHGTVSFNFSPLLVVVGISMSPGSDGIWKFQITRLTVNSKFDIKFHGGVLSGLDIGALKDYINKKAGETVTNTIKTAVAGALAKLTPYMKQYLPYITIPGCVQRGLPPPCKNFALNVSLTSSGVWRDHCFAEMQFDGFFIYKGKPYVPISSRDLPAIPSPCGDRSLSLLISEASFTSAVDAIFASGLIHMNVPSAKTAGDKVFNKLIPGLHQSFGNLSLYFNTSLISAAFHLEQDKAVSNFAIAFQILALTSVAGAYPKTFKEVLTIRVNFTVGMTAHIAPTQTQAGVLSLVYLKFLDTEVNNVTVIRAALTADDTVVQKWMQQLMTEGFNNAAELLSKGILAIPPAIGGIGIYQPELKIGDHHLKLALNVGKPPAVNMSAEELVFGELPTHHQTKSHNSLPEYLEYATSTISNMLVESQDMIMNIFTKSFSDLL
ncbi:uncharacterized protein LOC135822753 [Sycon ciliatum]|uniref:uncharacterized protein LOC135822753 n=1 Tax=Sycon ciliatum TaxID=27933 RepID=UPI0031F60F8E